MWWWVMVVVGVATHNRAWYLASRVASDAAAAASSAATTGSGSGSAIGMVFPQPTILHDILNALPALSSSDNTRPIFPLFLHCVTAGVQLVSLAAVLVSRDRLVYAEDIAMCVVLWTICGVVYRFQLRTNALLAARRHRGRTD